MKIGITGANNTGKTTLARLLSRQLALPLINEDMLALMLANRRTAAEPALHRDSSRQEITDWVAKRMTQLAEHPDGAIADRLSIDLLGRWLNMRLSRNGKELQQIVTSCRDELAQYQWILIPPFQRMSQDKANEDGLIRNDSEDARLAGQSMSIGLLTQLARPESLLFIPSSCRTSEERLAYVLRRIRPH